MVNNKRNYEEHLSFEKFHTQLYLGQQVVEKWLMLVNCLQKVCKLKNMQKMVSKFSNDVKISKICIWTIYIIIIAPKNAYKLKEKCTLQEQSNKVRSSHKIT